MQDSKGQEIKIGYELSVLVGERLKTYTAHTHNAELMIGRITAKGKVRRIPLKDVKSENIIILNKK